MSSNITQFTAQLDKFTRNVEETTFPTLKRKVTLFCLTGVVKKTPVDKGTARANWQVTLGVPSEKVFKKTDKSGENTITLGISKVAAGKFAAFEDVHISNNLSYINDPLEIGGFVPKNPGPSKDRRKRRKGRIWVKGGFSIQAPQGMVAITLREAQATTF